MCSRNTTSISTPRHKSRLVHARTLTRSRLYTKAETSRLMPIARPVVLSAPLAARKAGRPTTRGDRAAVVGPEQQPPTRSAPGSARARLNAETRTARSHHAVGRLLQQQVHRLVDPRRVGRRHLHLRRIGLPVPAPAPAPAAAAAAAQPAGRRAEAARILVVGRAPRRCCFSHVLSGHFVGTGRSTWRWRRRCGNGGMCAQVVLGPPGVAPRARGGRRPRRQRRAAGPTPLAPSSTMVLLAAAASSAERWYPVRWEAGRRGVVKAAGVAARRGWRGLGRRRRRGGGWRGAAADRRCISSHCSSRRPVGRRGVGRGSGGSGVGGLAGERRRRAATSA